MFSTSWRVRLMRRPNLKEKTRRKKQWKKPEKSARNHTPFACAKCDPLLEYRNFFAPHFLLATRSTDKNHVQESARIFLERPVDRSGHCKHSHLRPRQGHRAQRAVGRRDPRGAGPRRQEDRSGRPGSEEHAGPHARPHHRDPADEGRRHRRLHRHREDAAVLHREGARQSPHASEPARAGVRAVRLDAGRAPRDPGIGRRRRRALGATDRRADGCRGGRRVCRCTRRAARWCSTSAAARPRSRSSR